VRTANFSSLKKNQNQRTPVLVISKIYKLKKLKLKLKIKIKMIILFFLNL